MIATVLAAILSLSLAPLALETQKILMGPLAVSFGIPLNDESQDEVQNFQFTFGSLF